MKTLTGTQAFSQFILERLERPETDYEILFFEESIKAKKNRSILKFTKETTPFLKDPTFLVSSCVATLGPNYAGLDTAELQTEKCKNPFIWSEKWAIEPRVTLPLLSESDLKIMKSHTHALLEKARSASSQKNDMAKWMRSKMRSLQPLSARDFQTDDERKMMLETRLNQVSVEIERYEKLHVSTQNTNSIEMALSILHYQNVILANASDEEQLVDR